MAHVPAVRKFFTSAMVILPPKRFLAPINKIRAAHDKSMGRWLTHVPVVYPFVPNDDFPRAHNNLKPVLKSIRPFTVRLSKINYFNQKTAASVYVAPEATPANSIAELQKKVEAVFPEYNDLVLKGESGFAPHMTLGQFDKEGIEQTVSKLQAEWQPVEFPVKELYLISRNGDQPFEVRLAMQLGDEAPTKEYEENPVVLRKRGINSGQPRTPGKYKLFVSNLSWNIDSPALQNLFKDFNPKRAYVITDRIRDRSRGYGFVEFDSETDQQAALNGLQGKEIDGRQLLVKTAIEQKRDTPLEGEQTPQ